MPASTTGDRQTTPPAGPLPSQHPPLALLERRWASAEGSRLSTLAAALARASTLASAVHASRAVARRAGWDPWLRLVLRARKLEEAVDALAARHCLARALAAWARCRGAGAWRVMAAEACAAAAARLHHQQALLRRGMAALMQHALWARSLLCLHTAQLAAGSLRCWRNLAAAQAADTRRLVAMAAAHASRRAAAAALAAWQQGARRCRQERLIEKRREQKWDTVQRWEGRRRSLLPCAANVAGLSVTSRPVFARLTLPPAPSA